jgi:hypothetical protein
MFEIFAAIIIALIVAGSTGCASKKLMKNCDKLNDKWYECEEP